MNPLDRHTKRSTRKPDDKKFVRKPQTADRRTARARKSFEGRAW